MRRTRFVLALACAASLPALWIGAVATADPAGRTTLTETIRPTGSGFRNVTVGRGEPFVVRRGNVAPRATRARTRRSLVFFGQFTDPQLADEMSPLRAEFVDPVGEPGSSASGVASAWRPQEAMGPVVFDQTVRNMNANRTSAVRQGNGVRRRLQFNITTGDLADNQQFNETQWFIRILDGGRVDPFSGKPISASNPCNASAQDTARMNADVAARRYTGVQDFDDWRGRPADRYAGFWDPDEASAVQGRYSPFPRYPGLMDRAQRQFTAQGSRVPWFTSRGNHDGLTQGTLASIDPVLNFLPTSCLKVYPSQEFDPNGQRGRSYNQVVASFRDPAVQARLLAAAGSTPPDPDRRLVNKVEYKQLHGNGIPSHGYAYVDPAQNRASNNSASYYAYTRGAFRFIALDTVAEGGGPQGNLDDPQYRWLETELRRARAANRLVVLYGHHGLEDMNNTTNDENAGACSGSPPAPGCDIDPRRSTPIHQGLRGSRSLRSLLTSHPNVVAFVVGHGHDNNIAPHFRGGRGFWEIETGAHIDWPQQSRQIEIMDNRDGTLSIFTRLLDHAGKVRTPASGANAASFTETDLAAIARRLSLNDPHANLRTQGGARNDRNTELLIRDPR